MRERRESRVPFRLYFSFVFPLFLFPLVRNLSGCGFFWFLLFLFWWLGSPDYDRLGQSMDRKRFIEKPTVADMGLWPACSRIIYDYTHGQPFRVIGGEGAA